MSYVIVNNIRATPLQCLVLGAGDSGRCPTDNVLKASCTSHTASFEELCETADYIVFNRITSDKDHTPNPIMFNTSDMKRGTCSMNDMRREAFNTSDMISTLTLSSIPI